MIQQVHIENFKSLRDVAIPLADLTLLVGANAAGKSNIVEALQLLTWLAAGRRLSELAHALRDESLAIRGLPDNLVRFGERELRFAVSTTEAGELRRWWVKVATDAGHWRFVDEGLSGVFEVLGGADAKSSERFVTIGSGDGAPALPVALDIDRLAMDQLAPRGDQRVADEAWRINTKLQHELRGFQHLDIEPSLMRGYVATSDNRDVARDGSNVSAVLHRLIQDAGMRASLLRFVQHLPEQDIVDFEVVQTPRDEVMLALCEQFGGTRRSVDASLLSDGTLRVLAVAVALHSAPRGSLLMVEELDNGVHPSRAGALLRDIARVAKERGVRVLISSHNPALQDELPPEHLADVLACYRDRDDGSTCVARLGDLPRFAELAARGPLGELVTERTLDRFLPKHVGERPAPALDLGFLASEGEA